MPKSRRQPSPHELAAVLARLERLRDGPVRPSADQATRPAGPVEPADLVEPVEPVEPRWQPVEPPSEPDVVAMPGSRPRSSWLRSRSAARAALAARLPAAVRHGVLDPGRRGVVVLAAFALIAALGGAWYFVSAPAGAGAKPAAAASAPTPTPPPTSAPPAALSSGWPGTATPTPSSVPSPIVVDVVGKVASPGVVALPSGSRIADAVKAAGGALPGTDLTALDLASRLRDGQEIFVGVPTPSGSAAAAGGGVVDGQPAPAGDGAATGQRAGSTASAIVNLNTATLEQLESLPGVGPALGQRILDWRAQHGRFTSAAQLQDVSGIGPAKYAALKGRVGV